MLFLSPPDTVQVQLFTDESHHVHYAAATIPARLPTPRGWSSCPTVASRLRGRAGGTA